MQHKGVAKESNALTHLAQHMLSLLGNSKHHSRSNPKFSMSNGLQNQALVRCMHFKLLVITLQAGDAPASGTGSESASAISASKA